MRNDKHMGPPPLADESGTLPDAEAVLLVRHDECEVIVLNILAEKRVCSDYQVKLSVFELLLHKPLFFRGH